MSAYPKPQEPSMEEILASIRRIISDDEPDAGRRAAPPAAPRPQEPPRAEARPPRPPVADGREPYRERPAPYADDPRFAPRTEAPRPALPRPDFRQEPAPRPETAMRQEPAPHPQPLRAEATPRHEPPPRQEPLPRQDPLPRHEPAPRAELTGRDLPAARELPPLREFAPSREPGPARDMIPPREVPQRPAAPAPAPMRAELPVEAPRRIERPQPPAEIPHLSIEDLLGELPRLNDAPPRPAESAPVRAAVREPVVPAAVPVEAPVPVEARAAEEPRPLPEVRMARVVPPEPRRKDLLSPTADAAIAAAFETLGEATLPEQGRTVEDLMKEMLRPMLKTWLDEHLPDIVERLVRSEIERVSRGR